MSHETPRDPICLMRPNVKKNFSYRKISWKFFEEKLLDLHQKHCENTAVWLQKIYRKTAELWQNIVKVFCGKNCRFTSKILWKYRSLTAIFQLHFYCKPKNCSLFEYIAEYSNILHFTAKKLQYTRINCGIFSPGLAMASSSLTFTEENSPVMH